MDDDDQYYYHVTILLSTYDNHEEEDSHEDVITLVAGLISVHKFKVTILSFTTATEKEEERLQQEQAKRADITRNYVLEYIDNMDEEIFHRLFAYEELRLPTTKTTNTETKASTPLDDNAIQEAPTIFHLLQEYYHHNSNTIDKNPQKILPDVLMMDVSNCLGGMMFSELYHIPTIGYQSAHTTIQNLVIEHHPTWLSSSSLQQQQ